MDLDKTMRSVFVLLLTAASALSQQARIAAPSLGWVFDPEAMAIRPIQGTLGAATLGAPLDAGFRMTAAAIAAQRGFAIGVDAADGSVRVVRWKEQAAAQIIDGTEAHPGRIVLSPSGSSALLSSALLSSAVSARVQVITGLPDAPRISSETDLGEAPAAMAISDDGERRLFLVSGALWIHEPGGVFRAPLNGIAVAAAFRPGSREAVALTAEGKLHRIGAEGTISSYGDLVEERSPVGLRVSADGTHAYVAFANGSAVDFDSVSGSARTSSCNCKASGLTALRSDAFLMNDISDTQPLMVFDGSGSGPKVWFVPQQDRSAR